MVWAEEPETGERALKRVVRTFLNEKDELVHVQVNGETITCTTEHPFYVQGKGWVAAKDLKIGDKLELQNGEDAFVDAIRREKLAEPIQVFNFEVEDFHTYYVGANSVLVHNICTNKADLDKLSSVGTGNNYVYKTVVDGEVTYVGISNNVIRRAAQHGTTRNITAVLRGLSRYDARAIEQYLIECYRGTGNLTNIINSISPQNSCYGAALLRGYSLVTKYDLI